MGILDKVGSAVNKILGGSSSAKQAQAYALQQQAMENTYNVNTMKNLHQWEVEDLKAAGLNPALGYGGNTSGLATGTASGPQAATGDPIGMLAGAVGIGSELIQMGLTSAQKSKAEAEEKYTDAKTAAQLSENKFISDKRKAELTNMTADTLLKNAEKKFTNERARGFTKSESRSTSSSYWGLGHTSARTLSKTE